MISSIYRDCLNMVNLRSFDAPWVNETVLGILFCKIDDRVVVKILCSYIDEQIKMTNSQFLITNDCNITYSTENPELAVQNFQSHLGDIGVQYQRSLGCSEVLNHDMFDNQGYGIQAETGSLAIVGILLGFMCTAVVFVCLLSKACNESSDYRFNTEYRVMQ